MTPALRNFFLVLLLLLIGSSNPIAIKFALNTGWNAYLLGFLRMIIIGGFFLTFVIILKKNPFGPNPQARYYGFLAAGCKGVGVIAFYAALTMIPANRVIIITAFSPVINLILVRLILKQEKILAHHIGGVTISLTGLLLLLYFREPDVYESFSSEFTSIFADILVLISVIFHNTMIIFEKKAFNAKAEPMQMIVVTNIIAIVVFGLFFLFTATPDQTIPMDTEGLLIFLYLVTIVGIILFYYRRWLVSFMEVTYINSFSSLGKVISLFYAVVLLNETLSTMSVLCFALVLTGTWIAAKPVTSNHSTPSADRI